MRTPSRHLPPRAEPVPVATRTWVALGAVLGVLVWNFPWPCLGVAAFFGVLWLLGQGEQGQPMPADRARDSICTFARGFGREIDTWIVRALHEELRALSTIPPRAADPLELHLDDEDDLEDLVATVAQRAGYELRHRGIFVFGTVRRVQDVARLVNAQPLRAARAAS